MNELIKGLGFIVLGVVVFVVGMIAERFYAKNYAKISKE
jgi:hypothetical protein